MSVHEQGLVNPYYLMRGFTLVLFGFWTVRAAISTLGLIRKWTAIAGKLGLSAAFIRKVMLLFILRVTIYDPINVGLFLIAVAIWTGRISI